MREERYWITVSLEEEEMAERLREGIKACYLVHTWAIEKLRSHWTETLQVYRQNELEPQMTYYLRRGGYAEGVQRYTLSMALGRTVSYFNQNLRFVGEEEGKAVVTLPKPMRAEDFRDLDIQSRVVWRRYLENYGRITTAYGSFYLEGDWQQVLKRQAQDGAFGLELIPFLWHGITVRNEEDEWKIRFNLYDPNSAVGRRQTKKERRLHG